MHIRRTLNDPMYQAHRRWLADDGDRTLRLDFPLSDRSLVFDIGGFEGEWAAAMVQRYGCRVYVFEPVPAFAKALEERFAENPLVRVFGFGLADRDEKLDIVVDGDASSIYRDRGRTVRATLRNVTEFLDEREITNVDLAKINIEGGEFPLLESLIDGGRITTFSNLQVQFHSFVDNAIARRNRLLKQMESTHRLTWSYPFVWENWVRRDLAGSDVHATDQNS